MTRKLEIVTEAHIRYIAALSLSYTAHQKAYDYIDKLEAEARNTNSLIDEYLSSRANESASLGLHQPACANLLSNFNEAQA